MVRIRHGNHNVRWVKSHGDNGGAGEVIGWLDNVRTSIPPFAMRRPRHISSPVGPGMPPSIELEFDSIPFERYRLEGSANMEDWEFLRTVRPNVPGAPTTVVSVPGRNDPQSEIRFFRVVEDRGRP